MPMKKGTLGNNSYIFKPVLIQSTLLSSAVCPLVKSKSFKGSDKASRIYSGYNMSKSCKFYQFSYKIHITKDLLLWRILNGRGLPNCLTELPSLKCLSYSLHSRDSHPFANFLRPSPFGSHSASPTLTCALQSMIVFFIKDTRGNNAYIF